MRFQTLLSTLTYLVHMLNKKYPTMELCMVIVRFYMSSLAERFSDSIINKTSSEAKMLYYFNINKGKNDEIIVQNRRT